MIKITIGKGIYCENLPQELKDKIQKDLTFKNPVYEQAKKHGKYIGAGVSPFIYCFAVDEVEDLYWVPRGYIYYLKNYIKKNNIKIVQEDRTLLLPKIREIEFQGKLRPYQKIAVDEMTNRYPIGVLEAGTGSGKTVMACGIIAKRKQPTLIIVHNKELLYQWQGAIEKFLDRSAGLVGDGNFIINDITVGIVNSVRNKADQLYKKFGQIICDECHRVSSTVWTDTLQDFPAKHYLGLSATPYRRDGLGNAIIAYIGPKIHVVDKEMLHDIGAVLKPVIQRISTNFKYHYRNDYPKMITALCDNENRNNLIADTIYNDLKHNKENIVVVSDRVSHCSKLADMLKKRGIKYGILHGKVKASERSKIVKEVRSGEIKVLISTLQLIGEGFDAPNLSSIHITTPVKFSGRLLQVIGRVLRPEKNKTARVFDYRDYEVGILKNQGFQRDTIYKKQWR